MYKWLDERTETAICPVCSHSRATAILDLQYENKSFHYLRCNSCLSVFPLKPQLKTGGDALGGYAIGKFDDDMAFKNYVEIGAGIDSLLAPLMAVTNDPKGSLLDVGCGFGFLVDMWRKLGGADAAGVELASYGHWGKELLGANISHELLASNLDLFDRKFNIVFSAEVIEHVDEPLAFLNELKEKLADGGILILTTPSAEIVTPGTSESILLAALSPGAHRFVMSRQAMERMIAETGLFFSIVEVEAERLVAWASTTKWKRNSLGNARSNARSLTYKYLAKIAKSEHDWISGGALYRLFREDVDAGEYAVAAARVADLQDAISKSIGDIADWDRQIARFENSAHSAEDLLRRAPSFLGPFLYYWGMLTLNFEGNPSKAAWCFEASLRVNLKWAKVAPEIAQEQCSLLATSYYHYILASKSTTDRLRMYLPLIAGGDVNGWRIFEQRLAVLSP